MYSEKNHFMMRLEPVSEHVESPHALHFAFCTSNKL